MQFVKKLEKWAETFTRSSSESHICPATSRAKMQRRDYIDKEGLFCLFFWCQKNWVVLLLIRSVWGFNTSSAQPKMQRKRERMTEKENKRKTDSKVMSSVRQIWFRNRMVTTFPTRSVEVMLTLGKNMYLGGPSEIWRSMSWLGFNSAYYFCHD